MAFLFMDGFDHYSSPLGGFNQAGNIAGDILKKWTATIFSTQGAVGTLYGRQQGGQGLVLGNATGIYKTLPSSVATLTAGTAWYCASLPTATYERMPGFMDSGTDQLYASGDGAGHLTVVRGDGTVLATSTNTVSAGVWYYIELKATISNTVGVIELRVNGTSTGWVPSTGSLDTQNTANATVNQLELRSNLSNYFDDVYVVDASGSVNTSFLGPIQVVALLPNGAGNYAQWTANGGTNFGNVRDTNAPDGDITFNSSSTAGQIDTFTYEDLPVSAGSVFAVQHVLSARQDVGAARTLAPLQRSSATDYVGTNFNPSTSYGFQLQVNETNPDTSAAWTVSGFNSAEFGYKEVS